MKVKNKRPTMEVCYRGAAILLLALVVVAAAGPQGTNRIDSALIYLRGIPNDATVEINGTPVLLVPSKPLVVPPGSVQIGISADKTSIVKSFFLRGGDYRILNLGSNPDYATIDILSDPAGAEVYLDNEMKGSTPVLDSFFMPGTYMLTVRKSGYDRVERRINLMPQEELELTIELKRSKAWFDSVATAEKIRRQQRRFTQRLIASACGVVFSGAAAYFNWDAQKQIDHAETLAATYDGAHDGFNELRDEYYLSRERASVTMQRRDLFLGLSAATVVGFSLSFVF